MHHVYILYSKKLDKFYIGRTDNLDLLLQFHNNPIEARKFTAKGIPWELKLSIKCETKERAIRLEKFIKQMKSRKFIQSLFSSALLHGTLHTAVDLELSSQPLRITQGAKSKPTGIDY